MMKNSKQYIPGFQDGIVHDTNYKCDAMVRENGGSGQGDVTNII